MPYYARKPVLLRGVRYRPGGDPVPLNELPAKTKALLLEQRRIVFKGSMPEEIELKPDDSVPEIEGLQRKQVSEEKPIPKLKRKEKS